MSTRIDCRRIAVELHDFSKDAHDAVLEGGEVGREYAGSLRVVHCGWFGDGLKKGRM